MRFLEDDILRLRAVEPEDTELMWDIENDSSQWRENGMCAPYSRYCLHQYAIQYEPDPIKAGQLRMICEKKQGGIVGIADLYDISSLGRTAFIGIYMLQKFRGLGYSQKCLSMLEEYSKLLLNLRILGAKISELNKTSISFFEKAGYVRRAELPEWLLTGDEPHTLYVYTKKL